MINKLPISALVVGYNEGYLLDSCLRGIQFCDEIIYFDLGSADDSINIALKYGAEVILHEKVPMVESIHADFYKKTKHKWILITDPDENIDSSLQNEIIDLFSVGVDVSIGGIFAPWQFYFKKHKLSGTPWGGANSKLLLAHNERMTFTKKIHRGPVLSKGYDFFKINYDNNNVIHHFWMRSYTGLFEKHIRYLKKEGESRYLSGQRTTVREIIKAPFKELYYSLITSRGYKDFFLGLFLSIFWTIYQTFALIALFNYQIVQSRITKIP